MTVRRAILLSLLLLPPSSELNASTLVIRDSIGPGNATTNGMAGGLTLHDGSVWNTPGLVVTAPEDGELTEARFVIFARGPGPAFPPENNLANIYGYPIKFHIWTDGIEGGADSFDANPQGSIVSVEVNSQTTTGFIAVEPFGQTGPVNEFTTFLLTINLSSFNLAVQAGTEYVMGLIQDNETNFISGGGFFRISGSRTTGSEDVFRSFNTSSALRPGYVKSQLGNTFEQYAGSFTLSPLLSGDYDFDGDVDADDYTKWRENFGSTTNLMADGNDDNMVDAADYVVWRKHLGTMGAASAAEASVPEPTGICPTAITILLMSSAIVRLRRPRR